MGKMSQSKRPTLRNSSFDSNFWGGFRRVRNIFFEPEDFRETLDGGQAFTWNRSESDTDGEPEYIGFFSSCAARLKLDRTGRVWASFPASLNPGDSMRSLEEYFDLATDYARIREELESTGDKHIVRALNRYPTLRILRQNPEETIVSFICSSSKRIVQIKQCVGMLAKSMGDEICEDFNRIPDFKRINISDLEDIKKCKLGFRAKYLKKSAKKICDDNFDAQRLRTMDYGSAKSYLTSLSGIGEKVADCILLFGASRFEAFPVDTWIRKAMDKLYSTGEKPENIRAFARDKFGPYAGFAQQLIFASIRNDKS